MSPQAAAINQALVDSVLTMRATVYQRTGGTGPYNQQIRADLPCLLQGAQRQPNATSTERRDLAKLGTLRWDASYDMPLVGIQIEIDAFPGVRWNPVAAVAWPDYAPGIGIVGRTCDVQMAG